MATFTWYGYMGAGPAWADISGNTICFSGNLTDIDVPVTVAAWQDGSHVGDGDPGADQCGANHMNNVKWLTSSTMSINGGGSEDIIDANLDEVECTLKINFAHGSSVALSAVRLYAFDGVTETDEALGVDVNAFERGVTATAWTVINDDSGNTGGDNPGERIDLEDRTAATTHDYFLAISVSPESVGAKTSFDLGIALTYS